MKAFRFGVVAAAQQGGAAWRETARRAEELGYSTLLSPDNLYLPTPTATLAVAAAVTTRLRVGSYVLASPLRTARAAAWEAHSLTAITDGRFELGLGTGLPSMREQAEELGLPYGNGQDRLESISATIDHVRAARRRRAHPGDARRGRPEGAAARRGEGRHRDLRRRRARRTRDVYAAHVEEVRSAADGRDIEMAMNIFVVGEHVPPWMAGFIGADAQTLIEHDSLTMIRGSVDDMAAGTRTPSRRTGRLLRQREQRLHRGVRPGGGPAVGEVERRRTPHQRARATPTGAGARCRGSCRRVARGRRGCRRGRRRTPCSRRPSATSWWLAGPRCGRARRGRGCRREQVSPLPSGSRCRAGRSSRACGRRRWITSSVRVAERGRCRRRRPASSAGTGSSGASRAPGVGARASWPRRPRAQRLGCGPSACAWSTRCFELLASGPTDVDGVEQPLGLVGRVDQQRLARCRVSNST